MALLNTHTTVKKFIKHGFSEDQAEVIVEAINDQNNELVTKNDLKLAISELKSDISWLKVISVANFTILISGLVSLWFK
jgi:hypothetical protein